MSDCPILKKDKIVIKKTNGNEKTMKEALMAMVEHYRLKSKLTQVSVQKVWETTMGEVIARHTTEIKVRRRKLYITIDSAPLRQELFYGRETIKNIMNDKLGEDFIEEVEVR